MKFEDVIAHLRNGGKVNNDNGRAKWAIEDFDVLNRNDWEIVEEPKHKMRAWLRGGKVFFENHMAEESMIKLDWTRATWMDER